MSTTKATQGRDSKRGTRSAMYGSAAGGQGQGLHHALPALENPEWHGGVLGVKREEGVLFTFFLFYCSPPFSFAVPVSFLSHIVPQKVTPQKQIHRGQEPRERSRERWCNCARQWRDMETACSTGEVIISRFFGFAGAARDPVKAINL